jgi:diguanylate cyclase (GGDEF)-like protein
MPLISIRRMSAVIAITVLLIGGAVFSAATIARNSADHGARRQRESELMLTAMLNQETGARGYFETGASIFLHPYQQGASAFPLALAQSRRLAGGDIALQRSLTNQAQISSQWHAATQAQINLVANGRSAPSVSQALATKATMDRFRAANATYDKRLNAERDAALSAQTWIAVGLAAALSLILVSAGSLFVRRATAREQKRIKGQRELRSLLQVSDSEDESRRLLIRHLERTVPGCAAAVLNRNNSDDRLEAVVDDDFAQTSLRGVEFTQITPRSCLAVRLSTPYDRAAADEPLMECEVCGKIVGDLVCEPLLVGGQVIGSVLVAHEKVMKERERARVRDAVIQAAPILANQRNLALAELRAASDALTGLPNRRAADETLKRMAAHASRRDSPLAAVLLDLDLFKQINDIYGHEQGDRALAAVGQVLPLALRSSDFAARYGGEEFLVLLPDTDTQTAVDIAEKLRLAIAATENSEHGSLSASFGVASFPEDAIDSEQLIRKADRALYAAKAAGRNRVHTASAPRTAPADENPVSSITRPRGIDSRAPETVAPPESPKA